MQQNQRINLIQIKLRAYFRFSIVTNGVPKYTTQIVFIKVIDLKIDDYVFLFKNNLNDSIMALFAIKLQLIINSLKYVWWQFT